MAGETYRIEAAHSGLVLDVEGGSTANGGAVQQWGWWRGENQKWHVQRVGDGDEYRLINDYTGKALTIDGGTDGHGAAVEQWDWLDRPRQRFRIEHVTGDRYRIENVGSGLVLDVTGGSTNHGASLQQWGWGNSANQHFRFTEVSDGGDDSGSAAEPESHFAPDDGFATAAEWLDDDTRVIRVTELTREALAAAVNASGPRVVVFEVGGVIDLEEQWLTVENDKLFLAGQTAPSPGITLVRGQFSIGANDCIVQHIRSKPGDAGNERDWTPDAINTGHGTSNNVIDHCTATWSVDEVMSVGYRTDRTTLSNNLIAEGLHDASGPYPHSAGTLVGDDATDVALLGNVWAQSDNRQPRLKSGTRSVAVNNVIAAGNEVTNLDDDAVADIVGNTYRRTPYSSEDYVIQHGRAYLADNTSDVNAPLTGDVTELESRPLWPDSLDALPNRYVLDHAVVNAGARPADRTPHDRRLIDDVQQQSGAIIDSQEEVGGYPTLEETAHSLSVPDTGLREWLAQWARAVEDPYAEPPV
ncbi:RICIN domain-containing protein [Natrinema salsiterrestre]|uniref:RICIN domain-containing protein n=1 Tax=Natrinema salsiterrestre TaxID=2950540 RepID=A0A9Q4L8G0_9EURY|nr:RICIN domain-containing protein [Natrinema salsiterrestre]MDF9747146.1 RICIN domain-containing protein [Natrinema salsiterrestre]